MVMRKSPRNKPKIDVRDVRVSPRNIPTLSKQEVSARKNY